MDTDEVYMATRLSGRSTYFLPFNKGCGGGAGNPENPGGYKTAYLWEEVLERHSFLDILARFIHLQVEEKQLGGKKVKREAMLFPRYHQLDCVRKLVADARVRGAGTNYLVQHSAGSGKSNSIAWLAHRLASLYTEKDEKVFDSIIVVTDRVVLDQQLQNTIYQFEHKQGVVQKIDINLTQLAEALGSGVPVVITTLQKFPFVTEKMGDLPMRRYAVIVDEAHSSQGGETATELKGVFAGAAIKEEARAQAEEEGLPDYEEEILKTMAKRGHQPNISFFAFTATPKYKTLEVFGTPGADGKPQPFHLYSMRQAIDEGFILDVLQNYTTYRTYYRLIKSIVAVGVVAGVLAIYPGPGHLYDLLAQPLIAHLPHGATLIATSVISPFMVPLKILLMAAFMIALPVVLVSIGYLGKRMRGAYRQVQQEIAQVNTGVEQVQSGMDRLLQRSLDTFGPVRRARDEMDRLRARLEQLESSLAELEVDHDTVLAGSVVAGAEASPTRTVRRKQGEEE